MTPGMTSNIAQLKPTVATKPALKRAPSRKAQSQVKRQAFTGIAIGAVAATLTGLSLSHLAHGIEMVTQSPSWEAWAMAVGIDVSFIALELSQLAASPKVLKQVQRYARPTILGTLAGSAIMNATAFATQAQSLPTQVAAVALGVAIPGLVYALTRIGATIWIDCNGR